MPIESLAEIMGGPRTLIPIIQLILCDSRARRSETAKLEHEIRQRVANRTDALQREMGSLKQKASRDPLTGLYNRRMLDEHLPRLIERRAAARPGRRGSVVGPIEDCSFGGVETGLSLLMIDVDHFKMLNDTLGHAAGDELLRAIGQLIRSTIRDTDMAFRCGGDEFVVLLDGSAPEDGQKMAERLVCLVDALTKTLHVPRAPRLSIGVSRLSDLTEPTPQAMLQQADRALYDVKRARRAAVGMSKSEMRV